MWSVFHNSSLLAHFVEVFSRGARSSESCKFHKGDVVLEPTGDGVKPESLCTLESGLAAVSLGRCRK